MKTLIRVSRFIAGAVFTFSGFVKGIDPLGSAYKFSDYFSAFGIEFLDPFALPLAVILCTVEFMAGMMLLSGSFTRLSSWVVMLFMVFFTPLTLVLALLNPVSDCGCFGDAIHLTNWQTFAKNIIILLFVLIVFIKRKEEAGTTGKRPGLIITSATLVLFLLFVWINIRCLPVIDFRPYHPGVNLQQSMAVPADAPTDKYDIRFIYEKDGIRKEFTLADYPANDTTWKFVDQTSVLVSAGYVPPIHDFVFRTHEGADLTDEITGAEGYTLLMISKKTEEADHDDLAKGVTAGRVMISGGSRFYILTSSSAERASAVAADNTVLYGDETTLKTIIRANPGFVLVRNGTVAAMWSAVTLPQPDGFSDPGRMAQSFIKKNREREIITFAVFTLLLLISIFAPYTRHNN